MSEVRATHELAEERSLALHRVVAERVAREPGLRSGALERVDRWQAKGTLGSFYADRWRALLTGPLDTLLATLVDECQSARDLRQNTPFTFIVGPRERWRIWREVAEQHRKDRREP